METSHRKPALQSAPCCLICNRPFEVLEDANQFEEESERALICIHHPTIPADDVLTEVYYLHRDEYYLRIAEISALIRGQSVQAAWCTTQWFSLLLELNSEDLLLIYPILRHPAIAYIPRKYRAPNSPQGLMPLRAEGFTEVSGPSDRGKPKPGVRGVVAAMQLGLPIENIDVDHKSVSDIIDIAFAGYYKLRFIPMGWADLGYERDADDLALRWLNGREPQLIAMC